MDFSSTSTWAGGAFNYNNSSIAGQVMVIFGSGFRLDDTVTVGGTACTSVVVQGSDQILCTVPSKAAGSHSVVVANPDGLTSNSFSVTY